MDINLKHFRHECPLTLLLLSHDDQQHLEKICEWCEGKIVDIVAAASYYGCSKCPNFFMHKRCAELPREINHPFHPQHPLSLSAKQSNNFLFCVACDARLIGPHYDCSKCKFYLDHNCASLIPINSNHHDDDDVDDDQFATSSSSTTTALTHALFNYMAEPEGEHLLIPCTTTIVTEENKYNFKCSKCFLPFENSIIYVCLECNLLVHQSCADLPNSIHNHTYHPHHSLHRVQADRFKQGRCKACRNRITVAGYCCLVYDRKCKFQLHIECAFPMLSIKFKIHQHPLAFFSKPIGDSVQCVSGCICSNEECRSSVFRCVPCGTFDCHIHCVPTLPLTFKRDDCHRHALTLTKSPVNYSGYDDEEDYVTELYCDACEKPRNRECPTYYCAKCHYVAHVLCIISKEDILALREEPLHGIEVLETSKGNDNLISSLIELDEEIAELDEEINVKTGELETLKEKLETLKHKRDRFISSHPQLIRSA